MLLELNIKRKCITAFHFIALPVTFKRELQRITVKEGDPGTFSCEVSKPGAPVEWRKGRVLLKPGSKYEMKWEGNLTKLIINNIEDSDAGNYSCKTADSQTTAELIVKGKLCCVILYYMYIVNCTITNNCLMCNHKCFSPNIFSSVSEAQV